MTGVLRVASWNVNGLRACARKGFSRWLARAGADIVGLQEVRALPDELPPAVRAPRGYHASSRPRSDAATAASRSTRGASRTRSSVRWVSPTSTSRGACCSRASGVWSSPTRTFRKAAARCATTRACRTSSPSTARSSSAWRSCGAAASACSCWATSTPRTARSISRARGSNQKTSGFLPEERAEIDRWLAAGWVDVFRRFVPEGGHYSWWSQRQGARERNVGWRIDYVLASPTAMRFARGAWIAPQVRGSDHCPVGVDLDPAVLG